MLLGNLLLSLQYQSYQDIIFIPLKIARYLMFVMSASGVCVEVFGMLPNAGHISP